MRRDTTAVIRDKVLSEKLTITKVSIGTGRGNICLGCQRPISRDDVEYELVLSGAPSVWFDQRCLAAWRAERKRAS
jgi:hypothetical protein